MGLGRLAKGQQSAQLGVKECSNHCVKKSRSRSFLARDPGETGRNGSGHSLLDGWMGWMGWFFGSHTSWHIIYSLCGRGDLDSDFFFSDIIFNVYAICVGIFWDIYYTTLPYITYIMQRQERKRKNGKKNKSKN
jgi:hypothetical protein